VGKTTAIKFCLIKLQLLRQGKAEKKLPAIST